MSCGSSCGCGSCVGCKIVTAIVALLVTALTIAALVGVYVTHVTPEGWLFGSLNGSAAIIALLFSLKFWHRLVKKLCPCKKGGCCGGACPGCGTSPCSCK
jgi:hypothetical protein